MFTPKARQLLWRKPTGFAAVKCMICTFGWTRRSATGALTVCLLDREPVLTDMTDCDRFESKPEA